MDPCKVWIKQCEANPEVWSEFKSNDVDAMY